MNICFIYWTYGDGNIVKRRGKKQVLACPHCASHKIVQNGRPHSDKLQFYCQSCKKYFSEDALKGYPPSNIPFPVIAYLLYFRQRIPEFSNMRKYRRFVNHWLKYLEITDKEVSRQAVHHWIKNYEPLLDKVITFGGARDYCKHLIVQKFTIRELLGFYKYAIIGLILIIIGAVTFQEESPGWNIVLLFFGFILIMRSLNN